MRNKKAIKKILRGSGIKTGDPLRDVMKVNGVSTPQQLKMRLLWEHVLELVDMAMHPGVENRNRLLAARAEWRMAEDAENRRLRGKKK